MLKCELHSCAESDESQCPSVWVLQNVADMAQLVVTLFAFILVMRMFLVSGISLG